MKCEEKQRLIAKFERLMQREPQVDNSKWVKNLSSKELSQEEVNVLGKGLNFAVQHNKQDVLQFVASVETVIDNSDRMTVQDKDRLRQRVVSSVSNTKQTSNLSREEKQVIQRL